MQITRQIAIDMYLTLPPHLVLVHLSFGFSGEWYNFPTPDFVFLVSMMRVRLKKNLFVKLSD